eukprot:9489181-Pyramimonas_sp.AAC.1
MRSSAAPPVSQMARHRAPGAASLSSMVSAPDNAPTNLDFHLARPAARTRATSVTCQKSVHSNVPFSPPSCGRARRLGRPLARASVAPAKQRMAGVTSLQHAGCRDTSNKKFQGMFCWP